MRKRLQPFLFVLCIVAYPLATAGQSPSPAPAPLTSFALPLANGTTTPAVILPTQNGQAFLVYTTTTGQLISYLLTPSTQPTPPPVPTPPPLPPPTPTPTPTLARVITVTETTQVPLTTDVASYLDSVKTTYSSFTIAMVAEVKPIADSLTWIGRAAGKTYPYTFLVDASGNILWQGTSPTTSPDWLSLLKNRVLPSPAPAVPADKPCCKSGNCPGTQPPFLRRRMP